jgi:creatinine amidohydrolase
LPLATDTLVASAISRRLASDYGLFEPPPVTISCSHEHAAFSGTVSIGAATLQRVIQDVRGSLRQQGFDRLVIINGHGGNYVLSNVIQEANVSGPCMALFPTPADWRTAREKAGLVTSVHEDMHGGEGEVSILLATHPETVRPGYETTDHLADDRPHLLVQGMGGYTRSGIIGRPSLATAAKGADLLGALAGQFEAHLGALGR